MRERGAHRPTQSSVVQARQPLKIATGIDRPGSADNPGRVSRLVRRTLSGPAPRGCGSVGAAALLAEAVRAVDRLAAGRTERDLGLAAAVGARGAEHLARPAIAVAAPRGAVAATAAVAAAGRVAAAGAIAAV